MQIRRARAEDLPFIRRIYNHAVIARKSTCDEDEKSLDDRAQWFTQFNDRYPIFIGEVGGEPVAYGCLFKYSPKSGYRFAVENSLYVAPEAQGQGFGKLMLRHLIRSAQKLGYTYMEARIFEHNEISIALHRAHGFQPVGIQPNIANLDGTWMNNTISYLDLCLPLPF